ncbi:hypothetical protein VB773_02380 [Haloarculaceae archaeon H-GB2-1]|nr:hypothetical protein [Haloarculaceae archaeon H-GB2-1]
MDTSTFAERIKNTANSVIDVSQVSDIVAPLYYGLRPLDPEVQQTLASVDFPQIDNDTVDRIALFPDFYASRYRTVFLGLLAHVLYDQGIGSLFLFDDKQFPTCKPKEGPADCVECMKKSQKLIDVMGLEAEYLGDIDTSGVTPLSPNPEWMVQDAYSSVKRDQLIAEVDEENPHHQQLLEEYITGGQIAWQAAVAVDHQYDFDYLVTNIGPGLPKRSVLQYAKQEDKKSSALWIRRSVEGTDTCSITGSCRCRST